MMLPQAPTLPVTQRRLLRTFKQLSEQQQITLQDFADFLLQKSEEDIKLKDSGSNEPLPIVRPEKEAVVHAIKRLKKSYYMLDIGDLFTETSSLMTQHIMQGKSADSVIDELQVVFKKHYEKYQKNHASDQPEI